MNITLVRHGQTDTNRDSLILGRENIPMNDTGRRQCKMLRLDLDMNFDVCFSSPLIRAFETAMILVGDYVEIKKDVRLIERDLGKLEGKSRKNYDFKKYWNYSLNSTDKGVEGVQEIFYRCRSFLEDIKKEYPNGNILIVSHASIMRALHHILLETDLSSDLYDFDIFNCFYEEIEV